MTMDMLKLRARVSERYPKAEQIDDSVLCFTRTKGGQPFAVYYLDIASDLPDSKESLNQYQDHLIGKRYFDGRKSLQWSNYLYFLRSDEKLASSEARRAKEFIENDRTYARKFVISENDLGSVLEPHTVAPSEGAQHENVLSSWVELLTEAGLDRAILSDDSLPIRLKRIESDATKKPGRAPSYTKRKPVRPAQFLNTLELMQYRPFPLKRRFDFGKVNLIFGANASGKTSLLEAIELFYCGRNKRNPDLSPQYRLDAVLVDSKTESATSQRSPSQFRERNLAWYGQAEVRTNNLYKSFAQFNFLNTDAAVSLSESTEHIEEDLSKLLVGPDASKIWRDIERVGDEVVSKLKELRPYKSQIETELSRLEKLLTDIDSENRQSDVILERLSKMLARHNWEQVGKEPESSLMNLHGSLTELISISQQAVELKWVASPTTLESLKTFLNDAASQVAVAKPKLARLSKVSKEKHRINGEIQFLEKARKLISEVIRYMGSGLIHSTSEYTDLERKIDIYSNELRYFEDEFIEVVSLIDITDSVSDSLRKTSNEYLEAQAAFAAVEKEYSDFAKLREESTNLSQQLRQIASKLIDTAENSDECPLCHTEFPSGELVRHMASGVDQHLESLGQPLLSRMRERETALKKWKRLETALSWFNQFCKNWFNDEDVDVRHAVAQLKIVQDQLAAAKQRHQDLDKEIKILAETGLSLEKFEEHLSELRRLGFTLNDNKKETAVQILEQIDERTALLSEDNEKILEEIDELDTTLKLELKLSDDDAYFDNAISMLQEQIATTETIVTLLSALSVDFPWPHDRPVSELIATADGVRKVVSEARSARIHERNVVSQKAEGFKRKEDLSGNLVKLKQRIENFSQAQTVLKKIREEYSLHKAMESTLQINRAAIEAIFSSIHSPAEFAGLGPTLATLIRKADESSAKLSEISTGQRAAFGLSVFLAQNSQLTGAPPVVLIDDPIAHVDDLNSLSFLDYLREIAITGKRQIFFATANDKLATLFERKFDFLGGGEFRRFNLSRNAQ